MWVFQDAGSGRGRGLSHCSLRRAPHYSLYCFPHVCALVPVCAAAGGLQLRHQVAFDQGDAVWDADGTHPSAVKLLQSMVAAALKHSKFSKLKIGIRCHA